MKTGLREGFDQSGRPNVEVASEAARCLLAGGLVGLPTETVYGLAADASNSTAVARVFEVKGRPADHPVIVHIAGAEVLADWMASPDERCLALAAAFWPGPLTLVVERSSRARDQLTGGQPTVGIRCPAHPVALAVIAALAEVSGDPARGVAAPSANRFGQVSPTTAAAVQSELLDRMHPEMDLIIDGGASRVGLESTILDCTGSDLRVLRPGAISGQVIESVLRDRGIRGVTVTDGGGDRVRMPGMLAAHYAPAARVIVAGSETELSKVLGISEPRHAGLIAHKRTPTPPGWTRLAAPESPVEFAHDLYAALREADAHGLAVVVVQMPDDNSDPLFLAIRDRVVRASRGRH